MYMGGKELTNEEALQNFLLDIGCFTYKRIFTTKWYDISDDEDIEEIVEKTVRSAVGDILEMEKKVFSQLNQK